MTGRRKTNLDLGMARLYAYKGKRVTTYYTITADNKRINLGHDLKAAKIAILEMDNEAVPTSSIQEHMEELMAHRQKLVATGKLAASTLATNRLEIVELVKAFGKMHPAALRPAHVWQYLHLYRGKDHPERANREVALLSTLFNRLMGAGIVDTNPCVGVERNIEQPRDRLVTDRELLAFCKFAWRRSAAGQRAAIAAAIAYLTGKAQGQIIKLHRSQISEDGIAFAKRKRGAATLVLWSNRLRKYIAAAISMPSKSPSDWIIHTEDGSAYTTDGFKTNWQRLMKAWVSLGNAHFTFHDLRAKAVTDVTEQGRKASDLTGHRTESVITRVYDRRHQRRSKAVR